MIFLSRTGQFSIVEIAFLVLLFSVISSYIFFDFEPSSKDYHLILESGLDSIYYSQDYREILVGENLSSSSLTQDWSTLNLTLSKMYFGFELIVSDSTYSKKIFSCDEKEGKLFDERIISINSGSNYDFRKVKLGVCY